MAIGKLTQAPPDLVASAGEILGAGAAADLQQRHSTLLADELDQREQAMGLESFEHGSDVGGHGAAHAGSGGGWD
jgi:hypothetical protein